ncbi:MULTISPECIES: hypothetical protein [unclassified Microcoleus]|uniref:hypothetical protein n=1 Tax=unclassified Microcoleus TaxID=2642155 RepID=UPI002FCEEE25
MVTVNTQQLFNPKSTAYFMYMWYTQEEPSPAVGCVAHGISASFIKYEADPHPTD